MGAKPYPKPEPFTVLGVSDEEWKRGGKLLPSETEYNDYVAGGGVEGGPFGTWLAEVEAVKASHGRSGRKPKVAPVERSAVEAVAASPVQPLVPVKVEAVPPAVPFDPMAALMLPWETETPQEIAERPLNVDLPIATLDRLKVYATRHKLTMKVAVAGMLDVMLTAKGG